MLRVSVGFCMGEALHGGVLAEFGGGIAVGYEGLRMLLSLSFSLSLSLSLSLCSWSFLREFVHGVDVLVDSCGLCYETRALG